MCGWWRRLVRSNSSEDSSLVIPRLSGARAVNCDVRKNNLGVVDDVKRVTAAPVATSAAVNK